MHRGGHPQRRVERYVLAYRSSLFDVERFDEGDTLKDEEILPGFVLPVADVFRE